MRKVLTGFIIATGCVLSMSGPSQAFVFIHEILADPPAGTAGDANADGRRSTSQDEFVELFNDAAESADLSGWSLQDSVEERHVFAAGSFIGPAEALVIFGGGDPVGTGIAWQVASTGSLSLNNSGDRVVLLNAAGERHDEISYGREGGRDESLVRLEEGHQSLFGGHTSLPNAAGRRFSPGYLVNPVSLTVDEQPENEGDDPVTLPAQDIPDGVSSPAAVPEPGTLAMLGIGLGGLWTSRRNRSRIKKDLS